MRDPVQGEMRLIFTEHLIERDYKFPFDSSRLKELEKQHLTGIPTGRLSG